MNSRIGVLGSVVRDRKLIRTGELGGSPVWTVVDSHGGIGRNLAHNLGLMGVDTAFLGLTEPGAAAFERPLAESGVRLFLRAAEGGIGAFEAELDEHGDLLVSAFRPPALAEFGWPVVEPALDWLAGAGLIALETGLDPELLHRVRGWARTAGVPLCGLPTRLAAAGPRWELLRGLDLLVLNRTEAAFLLARPAGLDLAEAAVALTGEGIATVVITDGAAGAVSLRRGGTPVRHPAEAVPSADTTGAGDAFTAGLLAGLTRGADLADSVRLGQHAARLTVGCTRSTCLLVGTLRAPQEEETHERGAQAVGGRGDRGQRDPVRGRGAARAAGRR